MNTAEKLVREFDRMVQRDGGSLSLLGVEDGVIKVGYRLGSDPECEDGVCVIPHAELQTLMNETLARRDPSVRVIVEVIQ